MALMPRTSRLRRRWSRRIVAALLGLALTEVGAACGSAQDAPPVPAPSRPSIRDMPTVALQVGHWRSNELPGELALMRAQAGATTLEGISEPVVSMAIARAAKRRLEAAGELVDLVPATVRPGYRAAAFVSIHADGNPDATVTGFKVAGPERSVRARQLSELVERSYAARTGLPWHPMITDSMTGYYAFNSRRYVHAVDPATPGVVVETGFLTNPIDRRVIVDNPDVAAEGIANGVLAFLRRRG